MDWSIVLGIAGIVVSAGVGWSTYRLANRRAVSQRYANAKATVLQSLSKSLGEDAVPTPDVLQATIRSVIREVGDPKLKLDIDDVLDDLVRQVTSDPFLDGNRRTKLQGDIQTVRREATKESQVLRDYDYRPVSFLRESAWPLLLGTAAAVISAVAIFTIPAARQSKQPDQFDAFFNAHPVLGIAVLAAFIGASILVIFWIPRMSDAGIVGSISSFLSRRRGMNGREHR